MKRGRKNWQQFCELPHTNDRYHHSLSLIIIIISMLSHAYISIIRTSHCVHVCKCVCCHFKRTHRAAVAHLISVSREKASSFIYIRHSHTECLLDVKYDIITACMKLKNNDNSDTQKWDQHHPSRCVCFHLNRAEHKYTHTNQQK